PAAAATALAAAATALAAAATALAVAAPALAAAATALAVAATALAAAATTLAAAATAPAAAATALAAAATALAAAATVLAASVTALSAVLRAPRALQPCMPRAPCCLVHPVRPAALCTRICSPMRSPYPALPPPPFSSLSLLHVQQLGAAPLVMLPCPARRAALPCPPRCPAGLCIALLCPRAALLAAAKPCPARALPCWPPHRPALPMRRPAGRRPALPVEPPCPGRAPLFPSCAPPRPTLRASLVLARHPARRAVLAYFDTWLDDLQLYLLSDSRDNVLLFDHTFGASLAPPATADTATRSQWLTRDAAARLAIRNHLPLAEHAHFGQHKTAKALYDAVVALYSSLATAALSRLMLPYLFPELSAFATVEDLITHLRTSDTRCCAALKAEFLDKNPPSMYITLYFIVTRLPESLRAVRDHFLALDPTDLTVDLLEKHLLAAETSVVAVGAACGTPRTPFFEGCSPSPPCPLLRFYCCC
ncbi:unnamed protein product, partial [Closterium sp. NIES-54]